MQPGTYIFIVKFDYSFVKQRGVAVSIVQNDWNMRTWAFDTEKDGSPGLYGGVQSKTFVIAHSIDTSFSYKVEAALNWVNEGETNTAKAWLQAIRIA